MKLTLFEGDVPQQDGIPLEQDPLVHTFDGESSLKIENQVAAFDPGLGLRSSSGLVTSRAEVTEYSPALPQGVPTIPEEAKPKYGALLIFGAIGAGVFFFLKHRKAK